MVKKKILMGCANYWTTPLQVGSHHIARGFAKKGWDVGFISDPISPLHLLRYSQAVKNRYTIYKKNGIKDQGIWSYVPGAFLSPYNKGLLKSKWLHKNWYRCTFPSVVSKLKKHSFDNVDLLYIDSPYQAFLLDTVKCKKSIYRLADYNKAFLQTAYAKNQIEERLINNVDTVIYSAKELKVYLSTLFPRSIQFIPNGVDLQHFLNPHPKPQEYRALDGPIIVYAGAIREWFDSQLVYKAAQTYSKMHFVLIGPSEIASFAPLPNIHFLGSKPWKELPGYLQHAQVGIIPFNVKKYPELIHSVNPLKLYEYMASGIPVVSTKWKELEYLNSPAILAETEKEFIEGLSKAIVTSEKEFVQKHSWDDRINQILSIIP